MNQPMANGVQMTAMPGQPMMMNPNAPLQASMTQEQMAQMQMQQQM